MRLCLHHNPCPVHCSSHARISRHCFWRTLTSCSGPLHLASSLFVPHTLFFFLISCINAASRHDAPLQIWSIIFTFFLWRDLSTDNLISPVHRLGTSPTPCSHTLPLSDTLQDLMHGECSTKNCRRREGRKGLPKVLGRKLYLKMTNNKTIKQQQQQKTSSQTQEEVL